MTRKLDVEIRETEIDDLAPIFHLGEKVFHSQTFSNLYRTWDEYEVTTLFNQESENMFVAEVEGTVAGFAMGTVIEKSHSAWTYGHLLWLGVEPALAGHGIGGLLFDRFRRQMKKQGVRMMMVDTQADNKPAIRFFHNRGFENPTDHIYMTMRLN